MNEARCSECDRLWPEEELVRREDDSRMVCPECSGLLADEDLSCRYDESG